MPNLTVPSLRMCASRLAILASLALLWLATACSGVSLRDQDGDEARTKARPFSRLGPTEDKLDPSMGDAEDWRLYLAEKTGALDLRLIHGRFGKASTLAGSMTVYNSVGERVADGVIVPGTEEVTKLTFPVQANQSYLVQIKATAGKGDYAVEVGTQADACAACAPTQTCVAGKCADKPCGGVCVDGETCDAAKNRCVKDAANLCQGVHCGKGETCQRASGRCEASRTGTKCPAGQVPKDGECVDKGGDVECTVIDVREAGAGAVLTLSAGDNKGIAKGNTGHVKGVKGATFTIVDVYPSRSKAVVQVPATKLAGSTAATIKR